MTSTWNDTPTTPPTTDADLCATWAPEHDHPHAQPTQPQPAFAFPPADPATGAMSEPPQFSAPMPPPPSPRSSPSPSRGGGARVALVAALMVGLAGAGYIGRGLVDADTATTAANTPVAAAPSTTAAPSTPLLPGNDVEPVKAVAKALGPSVVVIKNNEGLGSGVVYDTSGLIITNAHVVGDASTVSVTLNDGRSLEGTVVGADTASDIAVVRVDGASGLSAARLADKDPEVGDLVVALGSPFGLDQTITSGVVSAVNRPVQSENGATVNMLQTDAAINPGNSGGALANRLAQVVGINSMIYSQSGDNNGIGFAIPIARAKQVADHLVAGQPVGKAYLGVTTKAAANGVAGAQVATIEPGSAAEQAGLKAGDVVTALNGTAVKDPTDLAGAVANHDPADGVTITVQRDGKALDLQATLGTAKTAPANPNARGQAPRTLN